MLVNINISSEKLNFLCKKKTYLQITQLREVISISAVNVNLWILIKLTIHFQFVN